MATLPTRNQIFRNLWTADAAISSSAYEIWARCRSGYSAYSSWLFRYFHISGPERYLVDVLDDVFTFGVAASLAVLAYALPPFSGNGDIWNRDRPYAMTFTDRDGNLIGKRGILQNDNIPFDEIPPVLIKAVLATEDARFYDHFGMDVVGTLRAVLHNSRGGSRQGGSSITQQVVKNLLLNNEKSLRRKINEAFLALWVEERLTKQQILKLYLDRSYLGGGATGVEAAAQFYFGKSVRDLNLSEAVVIAGLFKGPTLYAPHAHPEASKARSNVVLYRMLDAGFITQGELLKAKREPAEIVRHDILASPNWFLDWAYQDTIDVMQKHGLKDDYVIEVKTTIDTKLQNASQAIISDIVERDGPTFEFTEAASVTMGLDGAVKAIVGGHNYEDSQFNRAYQAKRQVGSSWKPFVYLAAIMYKDYNRDTIVEDSPVCVRTWCVHNFEQGYRGKMPLWQAMTHSVNTIAVKLMLDVSRKTVEDTARLVGITGPIDIWPTMAIGTSSLTLMDMMTGYATIGSGGKLAHPYAVLEIRKPSGELLYSHATNSKVAPQVVPADKMATLVSMMHNVVTEGTARAADLHYAPVAGKTGTNANFRDAWFLGFSAHNVTGVWAGNDDNTPMNSDKANAATGGHISAPAWKRIMDVAEFGLKPEGLPGVPLDPKAPPPLTKLDDPVIAQPVAVNNATPIQVLADSEAAVNPETPEKETSASQDILNGMIDLFAPEAQPAPKPVQAAVRRQAHQDPPVRQAAQPTASPPHETAPAPVRRIAPAPPPKAPTLFELLFGKR